MNKNIVFKKFYNKGVKTPSLPPPPQKKKKKNKKQKKHNNNNKQISLEH